MSTTLTIRRLDERVKERLRLAAAASGHSMEEEARQILSRALLQRSGSKVGFATAMREIFADVDVDNVDMPTRADSARDPFE
jgi:antitoxin FitA